MTITEPDPFDIFDLITPPEWHKQAACRGAGPDTWFPLRGELTLKAKRVCSTCPVQRECLEAGLHEHHGVWGGASERARRSLRRRRPLKETA